MTPAPAVKSERPDQERGDPPGRRSGRSARVRLSVPPQSGKVVAQDRLALLDAPRLWIALPNGVDLPSIRFSHAIRPQLHRSTGPPPLYLRSTSRRTRSPGENGFWMNSPPGTLNDSTETPGASLLR